jgi:hypothetical protein
MQSNGPIISKNDENQLRTYKEHVEQLATYIDNLETFDGAYKKDLADHLKATC